MNVPFGGQAGRLTAVAAWLWAAATAFECARATDASTGESPPIVTNLLQLQRLDSGQSNGMYFFRLEGVVLWAKPAQGRLVLQDATAAQELEMDWIGQPAVVGQQVRLEGHGAINRIGATIRLGAKGAVVDNDGLHSLIEKSGTVWLQAGRRPLRLEWFNGPDKSGLEVEFEGPGLARQKISDATLIGGLNYQCYEGAWSVLPDFTQLTAAKSGTVADFDLSVRTRGENVALRFTGFLNVPRDGSYTFYTRSDDGSRLFVGEPTIRLEAIGTGTMPTPRRMAIGQVLRDEEDSQWAGLEGKVTLARELPDGLQLELTAGAGRVRVEVGDATGLSASSLLNRRVRATGFCQSAVTTDGQKVPGVLLVPGSNEIQLLDLPGEQVVAASADTNAGILPVLTTCAAVHRLKREEAQRGYPVRIRGVVTSVLPEDQAFTIQDATRGLYVVDLSPGRAGLPRIGEFLEIEGATDPGLFAPIVNAQRINRLGAGHLPEPVRPTWDQLMNGSLDAQYVELQGIITAVRTNRVTLLTREGMIKVELRLIGMKTGALPPHENALVRIRGCLLAFWDYVTHQVQAGDVRIFDADLTVEQPAPADLFSTPRKAASELLLFDPQAGVLQRVKVSGQIVHARDSEYFMMDGRHGVRFIARKPAGLRVGDTVDVVGFPEWSSAFPVLREAVARRTGSAPLPAANELSPEALISADHDATLVRVEGTLVGLRQTRGAQGLEMQSGVRSFVARLDATNSTALSLPVGSKLELTGVYAAQGGSRVAGQDIASFELLLHSPADIKVLARPPWWTLERLLIIVGVLAFVLAVSVLWITQLHRKVEQRTIELEAQIQERQRVEHQRMMEQERARVAQDLHDELGSGLTEVSMLMARARTASAPDEKRGRYLEQVGEKAREMVIALDEIVWAMNPRHDSLASLVSYFSLYADRFLGLANIAWRLEGPSEPSDHTVDSRYRHQLFLAFKEALTNVVRHSGATEVRLGFGLENGHVRLQIADNGRGLPSGARTEGMDGVENMRARIEKVGGKFEVSSDTGQGTTLRFSVPAQ